MASFIRYNGSALFLPEATEATNARAGYLLPVGASAPDSLSLSDALQSYPGCFVLFGELGLAPEAFIAAAQTYLSDPARRDVLIAFFESTDPAVDNLTAWLFYAPRVPSQAIILTRFATVEFANLSINFPPNNVITSDGSHLLFAPSDFGNSFNVTPFNQSNPIALALSNVSLNLLGQNSTQGCFAGNLSLDASAANALDFGLRNFTADPEGGYTATSRFPIFPDASYAQGLPMQLTLDPLAPLNESRSLFQFTQANALASNYRSAVGGVLSLAPQNDACLVFANRLLAVDANGNPVQLEGAQILYLLPKGSFTASTPVNAQRLARAAIGSSGASVTGTDLSNMLMCGLSAVEYLSTSNNSVLQFFTDGAAFAPTLQLGDAEKNLSRNFGPATTAATTAWAYLADSATSTYFAQPDSSVLYQNQASSSIGMLNYLQLVTAQLAAESELGFPMLPYAGAQAGAGMSVEDVAQFEAQVFAPLRRNIIAKKNVRSTQNEARASAAEVLNASTPQGLQLTLSDTLWQHLTLAISPSIVPSGRAPALVLSNVRDQLLEAMQSNQLFLVMSLGSALLACADIPYSLTAARYDLLQNVAQLDAAVLTAISPLVGKTWPNQTEFSASLQKVLTKEQFDANSTTIFSYTGDFSLYIADWEFDLSPWRWADHNTILLFKFCDKQLLQLASDPTQWSNASTFNASSSTTSQLMLGIFEQAIASNAAGDKDYSYFVQEVLLNPDWNGVLALNAETPMSGFPPELRGLAAGIDAAQFQAHHVGINITPVAANSSGITGSASATFGLIAYEDPSDLVSSDEYQFKVNSLRMLISNSEITNFSSKIELLINRLFAQGVTQIEKPNNNLTMQGYYQETGGVGTYVFITSAATAYRVNSLVLDQVGILQAQFNTLAETENSTLVTSRFALTGTLSFLAQTGFDLFSYGPENPAGGAELSGLQLSNLTIDMSFDQATPNYKTFSFNSRQMQFNTSTSQTRANSLAAHFPMQLAAFVQQDLPLDGSSASPSTPESMGYMPVDTPLQGEQMSAPWFGLQYNLDLGSLGALASQAGFTASFLLAWSTDNSTASTYVGLSLPGVSGGQRAISLEGVLTLSFGEVQMVVSAPSYMLMLRNIALKFFSFSFPPNGQTNLVLFGNPNAQTSGALGWYASYLKNGAGQKA